MVDVRTKDRAYKRHIYIKREESKRFDDFLLLNGITRSPDIWTMAGSSRARFIVKVRKRDLLLIKLTFDVNVARPPKT